MIFIQACAEKAMSDDEYRLLRNLVYDECGIWLKDEKKAFLTNKALQRMRVVNITSYYRYYRHLTDNDAGKGELSVFLDSLTINETSFFRNRPQIDLFTGIVLPEVVSRKRREGDLNLDIWSAGCSTGQEPYTISMVLNERVQDLRNWRVRIMGSDLSLTALEAAQRGVYEKNRMEGVSPELARKYFEEVRTGWKVRDELKDLVVFDFHNLMHENGARSFDVIFCRNVLIYFDEPVQKRVIDRFYKILAPGGYIFLGHAESLQGIHEGFDFIHHNKGTAYRKK